MNTNNVIVLIVSILCPICSLVIAALAFRRNSKKDTQSEGQEKGIMLTEMGYIKSGIDRIEKRIDQLDAKQDAMARRLTTVETKLEDHLKDKNSHNYKTSKGGIK